MRIVIELKRDAIPRVVLNQLYKHTAMQSTFGVIMLALSDDTGSPCRRSCRSRRCSSTTSSTATRSSSAARSSSSTRRRARAHPRGPQDRRRQHRRGHQAHPRRGGHAAGDAQLQKRFKLSERQAEAILNMRLAKLTGLEIEKLEAELKEVRGHDQGAASASSRRKPKRMNILKHELSEVVGQVRRRAPHRDHERRRRVHDRGSDRRRGHGHHHLALGLHQADLGLDVQAAAARRPRAQRRDLKDEDFVEHLFIASTHDYMLFFTDDGRCFWLKVHEIPQAGRAAQGQADRQLINVSPTTQVSAMVPVREFPDDQFLLFATKKGTVKKTRSRQYANVRDQRASRRSRSRRATS